MIKRFDPEPEPEPFPERVPETRARLAPPRRRPPTAVGTATLPPEPAEPYRPGPSLIGRFARGSLGATAIAAGLALAWPFGVAALPAPAVLVLGGLALLWRAARAPRAGGEPGEHSAAGASRRAA